MKRLSSILLIFLYTILVNSPAFTAENEIIEQPESLKDIQAESVLDNSNEIITSEELVKDESEAIDNEEENEESEIASSSVSLNNKKEYSWNENVSGKQLNTLKARLEELQELYNINWRSYIIAESINAEEKALSPQKRNNSLLNDISRQQPFSLYAATFIFPEFLEIYLKTLLDNLKIKTDSLVDEIVETPEEFQNIIKTYANDIENLKTINKAYKVFIEKAQGVLDSNLKKNINTANLTNLGYYIKNTNTDIFKLIAEQIDDIKSVSEQLDLAIDYCESEYGPVSSNANSVSIKGKYIAEIRSSIKDILELIKKYEYKQEFRFYKLGQYCRNRYEQLQARIGNDEIRSKHINKYMKNIVYRPVSKSIEVFDAQNDLDNMFCLFGFKKADEELLNNLIPYINSESWHIRYSEPSEENRSLGILFKK